MTRLSIVLIAACLPLVGAKNWGRKGFVSGFLAGIIFFMLYHTHASMILTEPLFTFMIFLVMVSALAFARKETALRAAVMGLMVGLALLTKGSLIFVPVIYSIFFLIRYIKTKEKNILRNGFTFIAAVCLILAPWAVYASLETKNLVIISSEGENILLDS